MKSVKIALLSLAIIGFTSAVMNGTGFGQEQDEYVGQKGCAMCHPDQAELYEGNAHAALPHSCEECHGPGHEHAAAGPANLREMQEEGESLLIEVPETLAECGECHKRTDDLSIVMVGDFVLQNRQEYPEMLQNLHNEFDMNCTFCHDPHAPVDSEEGIKRECLTCHTGNFEMEVAIAAMADVVSCEDCHMPLAVASGEPVMDGEYQHGDIRSHLFTITTDPDYTINANGVAATDDEGKVRMTVEMTCYPCHKTGEATDMTRDELLKWAGQVHPDD